MSYFLLSDGFQHCVSLVSVGPPPPFEIKKEAIVLDMLKSVQNSYNIKTPDW